MKAIIIVLDGNYISALLNIKRKNNFNIKIKKFHSQKGVQIEHNSVHLSTLKNISLVILSHKFKRIEPTVMIISLYNVLTHPMKVQNQK